MLDLFGICAEEICYNCVNGNSDCDGGSCPFNGDLYELKTLCDKAEALAQYINKRASKPNADFVPEWACDYAV